MIGQSEMRRRLPLRARPEIRQRPYFPQYMLAFQVLFKNSAIGENQILRELTQTVLSKNEHLKRSANKIRS